MKYTAELGEALCEQLATSLQTLDQVCRQFNITRMTVWRWRHSHPEFERMYAEARLCQREMLYDFMLETMQQPAIDSLDLRMKKLQIDVCKTILARDIRPVAPRSADTQDDDEPVNLSDEQFQELLATVIQKNEMAKRDAGSAEYRSPYQPPAPRTPPQY